MRSGGVGLLAGLFGAAALGVTLFDFTGRMDSLRDRLEESDGQLQDARREIQFLKDSNRRTLEGFRASLGEVQSDLRADVRRGVTRDVDSLYRDVLSPSVQVNGKGGVGGGTLFYSRKDGSYVVTAYHVVEKGAEIEVRVYDARGAVARKAGADLAAWDDKKDLALLRLRTQEVFPSVARLASRETLRRVKVFTPVYAVGCPLGHDPLPTVGEVATLHKEVAGEKFWIVTAPTIFGNSGGGVFHRETRELLGVSVMICTYDGAVSTPVPHLGILASLEAVYDWLDGLDYQFLYDAAPADEACESARRP